MISVFFAIKSLYFNILLPPFLPLPLPNGTWFLPFQKKISKKSHFFTEKTYFFALKNQIFVQLLSQRAAVKCKRAEFLSYWAKIYCEGMVIKSKKGVAGYVLMTVKSQCYILLSLSYGGELM
ncbi:MAG: hypothetical protein IJ250_00450 [Bacteroidales bacterium]|nr:hypothetical protein [Bacteroidales bacterium]